MGLNCDLSSLDGRNQMPVDATGELAEFGLRQSGPLARSPDS
jgi:hypothetical protein